MFELSLTVFGDLEIDEKWLEVWRSISLLRRYLALAGIGIFDEFGTIIGNWVIPRSQLLLIASLRWSLKLWAFALNAVINSSTVLPLRYVKEVTSIDSADFPLKVIELRALHVTYPLHEDHALFKKAPRDRTGDHSFHPSFSVLQSSRFLY